MLRAKSVGEMITLNLNHRGDTECEATNEVLINLDTIKVHVQEGHEKKIMLTDTIGVVMKYPTIASLINAPVESDVFDMISNSIESIFDNENVYESFEKGELEDWVENLSQDQFLKIQNFFTTMPKLSHKVSYTCKECGEYEELNIEGLQSFFT